MTSPTVPPEPPPATAWERSRAVSVAVAASAAALATIAGLLAVITAAVQLAPWWYLAVTPAGIATSIAAGHWIQRGGRR